MGWREWKHLLELWSKYENVAMHFNELLITLRANRYKESEMKLRANLLLIPAIVVSIWYPNPVRADTLKLGDKTYENVKVVEDVSQYYIQVPSLGKTLSVTKDAIQRGDATIIRGP